MMMHRGRDWHLKLNSLFFSLVTLTVFTSLAWGQEDKPRSDEEILEMERLVVTATRTAEELLDVPGHVTVITEEEIRASGASNLAKVLDNKAGVSVSDFGPEGSEKSISLRGSTTSQVLVLIDGVRANNAQNGVVDLSLIPLDNIERIEIVRGGMSALYGADAVGGVINVITKRQTRKEYTLRIAVENGSYLPQKHVKGFGLATSSNDPDFLDLVDTQRATAQLSHDFGPMSLNAAGSFIHAQNAYIFKDGHNENRKRENAELLGGDLWLAARFPMEQGFFDLSGSYLRHRKGIPGTDTLPTPEAEQEDQRIRTTLHFKTERLFTDLLTLDLTTHFTASELSYSDPTYATDSLHRLYSAGAEIVQEALFLEMVSFVYGGSFGYDTIDSTDLSDRERIFGGAFVEIPLYIGERFTLIPAARYDYYSDFYGALGFRLGSAYRLSDSLSIKASLSRSFRAPTFNDLYWPSDAFAEGNPDLEPETGYNADIGFTLAGERLHWDAFLFARYVRDVILWQPGSDGIWRPTNYGEALYPGLEQQLSYRLLESLNLNLGYTFLYSFALSGGLEFEDNRRLPMIPIHEVDFGFSLRDTMNIFSVNLHYESLRYLKTSNASYLPSHFVVNLHFRRKLSEAASFYVAADNLFSESYEVVDGYPMPGLMIRTGVEARF
jgi:vitamin B12 transporter